MRTHKTVNTFAVRAKRIRSKCNMRLLYILRLVGTVPPKIRIKNSSSQAWCSGILEELLYV